MNQKTLHEIYFEHTGKSSDRWSIYISTYERLLNEYRNKPVSMLEIGVQNGGSLEVWAKYFPLAKRIIGCDINENCRKLVFEDNRITLKIGNANDRQVKIGILEKSPSFDIIIDDGSHYSSDIINSFIQYFPHLKDGGIFIAEDLHCSYWNDFEGGILYPYSAIEFFKRLVDVVNEEHWNKKSKISILDKFYSKYGIELNYEQLKHIHSIEFVNSICVVRKKLPEQNVLGDRISTGRVSLIVNNSVKQVSENTSIGIGKRVLRKVKISLLRIVDWVNSYFGL